MAPPVCRVRLAAVSRCPGGVGRDDGVGSAAAGPVHQDHSLGMARQDCVPGMLDGRGVVPGAAAGEQQAERQPYGWLLEVGREVPHPIAAKPWWVAGLSTGPRSGDMILWAGRGSAPAGCAGVEGPGQRIMPG